MNANLARKHEIVDETRKMLENCTLAVLADYRGVDVAGMSQLRKNARDANVSVKIMKNSLARRAVENTRFECLADSFSGPLAIAWSEDPVALAKVVSKFEKSNEHFSFRAGAMDGQALSAEQFSNLASLPSHDELIAKFVGTCSSPLANFVTILNRLPTSLVLALSAVRDQKQQAENT